MPRLEMPYLGFSWRDRHLTRETRFRMASANQISELSWWLGLAIGVVRIVAGVPW